MKEQTPITADRYFDCINWNMLMHECEDPLAELKKRAELYAQAKVEEYSKEKNKAINNLINTCNDACAEQVQKKVLEALEREFLKVDVTEYHVTQSGKEYYETEVKPKYEN